MEQRRVGRSGLHVSCLGLGTMTWGRDTDEDSAREQLHLFLTAGGTLVETSPHYGAGDAETLLGTLLSTHASRSEVQILAHAGIGARPEAPHSPAGHGGRGYLLDTLDRTLARIGTDHVDLWMMDGYDPLTPLEETLDAVDFALRSGRTRYVGFAHAPAWTVGYLAHALAGRGALTAIGMERSLLCRRNETELFSASQAIGAGIIGYAPVGRGVLTGKYRGQTPPDSRAATPHLRAWVAPYLTDASRRICESVATAAYGLERPALDVAISWALASPQVSTAIVGARTPEQLGECLAGTDFSLPVQIRHALDDVSAATLAAC